jgi:DNA-binding NarL/FixJ family response regulator
MAKLRLTKESPDEDHNSLSILLADDHKIVRSGLRSLIERNPSLKIVAEADQGRMAVQLCREFLPDVVITDISMPDLNGIEATRQILEISPKTKVIILSMHSSQHFVEEVFKAGASGYLLKDCSLEEVVSAIDIVAEGGTYLCPRIATVVREDFVQCLTQREASFSSVLSSRECEVLQLIAEGKNTKEIAFRLKLSAKTIEAHRQRIMKKLNLYSIAELTKYAIREGLTSEES